MDLKLLYGKGLYKIISTLHKNEELNFREVCRLSNLTPPTVKQHLSKLKQLKIITEIPYKNLLLYELTRSKLTAHIRSTLDVETLKLNYDHDLIKDLTKNLDADIILLHKNEILLVNQDHLAEEVLIKPNDKYNFRFITLNELNDQTRNNSIALKNGELFYQ